MLSSLDTKSLVIGAVLGAFVVPRVVGFVRSQTSK